MSADCLPDPFQSHFCYAAFFLFITLHQQFPFRQETGEVKEAFQSSRQCTKNPFGLKNLQSSVSTLLTFANATIKQGGKAGAQECCSGDRNRVWSIQPQRVLHHQTFPLFHQATHTSSRCRKKKKKNRIHRTLV